MPVGATGSGRAPYFFLGYAHTPQRPWVERLYRDLCAEIVERTDHPTDVPVGFMDQDDIRPGEDWREAVALALATCRVFVPLYSPRYFSRAECGREWHAFTRRLLDDRARHGEGPARIVPALWTPVRDAEIPAVARDVQVNFQAVNSTYAEHGLFTLIKNSAYRRSYLKVVKQLADDIRRAAEETPLQPCSVTELHLSQDDFQETTRVLPAHRRLTILVASPTRHRLPAEREAGCYGSTAAQWSPYAPGSPPGSTQPIAVTASLIARSFDYEPTVLSLEEGLASLDWSRPDNGPGVALIDPWLCLDESRVDQLQRFDELDAEWFGAAVVWNLADAQTRQHADDLRKALQERVPRRLSDTAASSSSGTMHVQTFEQLRARFPSLLDGTFNRYLNRAQAHPPPGTPPARPWLSFGGSDGD